MAVKKDTSKFIIRNKDLCVTLDSEHFPSNVRKAAADVTLELVERLLTQGSDDAKSLCKAVNVSAEYSVKEKTFYLVFIMIVKMSENAWR